MAKVRIGFFSFTEITDPAEQRSYNEWHQLDHMPEQYLLPGVLFGQRWVSTPACRRARAVDAPTLRGIHYMTLYLMGEPLDTTLEEFRALGATLRDAGRFHHHRRSRLSGPFTVTAMSATPRVLVSAEAVPYRPNRGVYVVVREVATIPEDSPPAPGSTPKGTAAAEAGLAAALLEAEGVAGTWTFSTDDRFDRHGWHLGAKTVTVSYLDAEPLAVAPELGALVRAQPDLERRPVLFAGPLETITPWRWDWFDEPA